MRNLLESNSYASCQSTRLRAVSLFSWSVEQNARDTQMITRVTEGARRERHEPPSFLASRGFATERSRACTPLTKSEEKERLLAVYTPRSKEEMRHCSANNFDRCCVHSHVAKRLTGFKLCATTPNRVCKRTNVTIQQCCVRLHGALREWSFWRNDFWDCLGRQALVMFR